MNAEKLSARLEAVARYVPHGFKLADIGSDHAYLPCYLVKKGIVPFAVAGEVVLGPFESARGQVQAEGLTELIAVRMGDGLEVIEPGDVDCITIAGMGGALIASILERGKQKLDTIKRLILQPNVSAIAVRKWLLDNNWELIDEEIIEEDDKIYEIVVAEKGAPLKPYGSELEKELLLGPYLLRKKQVPFIKKWEMEMASWKRILDQLEKAAATAETNEKKQELLQKINQVEEAIKS